MVARLATRQVIHEVLCLKPMYLPLTQHGYRSKQ
jgi:hypothetical protein